jgi:predicted MFS family arabinose efflux permease
MLLALPLGTLGAGAAALLLGVAGGLPFALVFGSAQRLRPDAPGAALAFVNSWAVLTIMIGTPLAGLGFALPGAGRTTFVLLGLIALAALPAVWRAPFLDTTPALGRNGDTPQITTARRPPWP